MSDSPDMDAAERARIHRLAAERWCPSVCMDWQGNPHRCVLDRGHALAHTGPDDESWSDRDADEGGRCWKCRGMGVVRGEYGLGAKSCPECGGSGIWEPL